MAAIPERYFQEKTLGLLGASIYGAAQAIRDDFTASLRSACSLRSGHFVNSLGFLLPELHYVWRNYGCTPSGAAPPIGVTTSLAAIALRPGNVLQAAPITGGAVVG